jgi:23S rRNA U2552 (ribose-2'-O)-methylase RlmE/FtsJ
MFRTPFRQTSSSTVSGWVRRQVADPYVAKARENNYRSRAAFKLIEINERHRIIHPGDCVIDLGAAPGSWSQVAAGLCRARHVSANISRTKQDVSNSNSTPPSRTQKTSIFALASEEVQAMSPAEPSILEEEPSLVANEPVEDVGKNPPGRVIAIDILPMHPIRGVEFLKGDFTSSLIRSRVMALLAPKRTADVVLSDMAHSFVGNSTADYHKQMELSWTSFVFANSVLKKNGIYLVKTRYGEEYKLLQTAIKNRFHKFFDLKPESSRKESSECYLLGIGFVGQSKSLSLLTENERTTLLQYGLSIEASPLKEGGG